jgi:hypothetical protein
LPEIEFGKRPQMVKVHNRFCFNKKFFTSYFFCLVVPENRFTNNFFFFFVNAGLNSYSFRIFRAIFTPSSACFLLGLIASPHACMEGTLAKSLISKEKKREG